MATGEADFKVRGGKFLRVGVQVHGGTVAKAVVNGDFFIHPESALAQIEASLVGVPLSEPALERRIRETMNATGALAVGFTEGDLAMALVQAAAAAQAQKAKVASK